MIICPNCQTENPDHVTFCRRCSTVLNTEREIRRHTALLNSNAFDNVAPAKPRIILGEDTIPTRKGLLRLEMFLEQQTITIPIQDNISLGRPDPLTNSVPDVDFTALKGYKLGVSRRHAEIHWYHDNVLNLYDLGSSNGTFLNGDRLPINTPIPIYNGDVVTLGELRMYVYYEIDDDGVVIPLRKDD